MNKKLISSLVAGLALSTASIAPAAAAPINVTLDGLSGAKGFGVVQFSMLDMGSLYGGNNCATAAACDGITSVSTYKGVGAGATGNDEDSWGIFSITSITVTDASTSTTWLWNGTDGGHLGGIFYGVVDTSSTSTSTVNVAGTIQTDVQTNTGIGGRVDIYKLANPTGFTLTTPLSDRNAQDDFKLNATDSLKSVGSLWLTGDFDNYGSVFTQKTTLTGPNAGSVSAVAAPDIYADLLGGAVLSQWDTNGITSNPNNVNSANDFGGSATFPCQFNPANPSSYTCGTIWTTKGVANIDANKIPEPGSMALVGLGLMGLAGLRRRKQQA